MLTFQLSTREWIECMGEGFEGLKTKKKHIMRAIKFRAFNKVDKNGMIDLKKITHLALDADLRLDGLFLPFDDNIILMQYTGLKDKNVKEIYEGDILSRLRHKEEGNWASPLIHSPDYCTIVVFKNGMFVDEYTDKAIYEVIRPNYIGDNTEYEIIGNIYQNPDLLTK